ncbi:MAG TPA: carbamoyltransferase HypF [Candidatus Brocadiales bacterium]|nr:carbamoyltransferase HypF [Candidatus Brocadiales bacterium]
MERRLIITRGIVQGVGFRPFVFRLATHLLLKGYVQNDTHGVSIDIEGERERLDRFINSMLDSPPPQALIEELHWQDLPPLGYTTFEIKDSQVQHQKEALVAPDIATCEECLKEFFDPADRRYLYPFINCSHCGPRYTITRDIPYDRANTTMDAFIMCQDCSGEYHDPQDRRFHAQPNACSRCGPRLRLLDCRGNELPGGVLEQAVSLLKGGRILAIKGIGGYHLAVDATQSHVVSELRNRKRRCEKPFALMARDLEVARRLCHVGPQEAQLLLSAKRPIVLLEKRPALVAEHQGYSIGALPPMLNRSGSGPGAKVAEGVAPGCKELGIMLPYTPLHHYLLRYAGDLLVMTSGNVTDEPIVFEDPEALARLKDVADYFLVSDRPIFTPCDDSVVRANPEFGMRNSECGISHSAPRTPHSAILIRRARGYAPYPLRLASPFGNNVLACGAMLKNTFCIGKKHHAFLSPHIGDLENLETLGAFQQGIERFKKMLYLEPDIVAYDTHPDYLSTQYALGLEDGISKIPVQHHHAHVVSCMAENGLEGEVIGVAFDGLGYGEDGHLWGGEFLLASPQGYRRMGHLEYVPMPGGQKAIKEPWRMALSHLYHLFGEDFLKMDIEFVRRLDKGKWPTVKEMMDKKINSPLTSSMGRLFDGVSALMGIRGVITYEGQAAVELEQIADEGSDTSYHFKLKEKEGKTLISCSGLFEGVLQDLLSGTPTPKVSSRFHHSVALMTGEVCKRIRGESGQKRVVLSGGVFQNVLLLRLCEGILSREGFDVYIHHKVPTNDGGLSLGQAVIADRRNTPPLKEAK